MTLKLETPRLLIREWNVADAKSFFPLSSDPALNSNSHGKMAQANLDETERKIIEWALIFGQTKMGILPIFLKENKTLIGVGGIKPLLVDKGSLHFEIICRIASEFSGHGYASEAIPALVKYGFNDLGLKELVGVGQSEYPAGLRVLEKAGMSFLKSVSMQNKKVDIFSVLSQ